MTTKKPKPKQMWMVRSTGGAVPLRDGESDAIYRSIPMGARFLTLVHPVEQEKRSIPQNRLQRLWMNEAESQGDQTAEEYRGFCKLHFGIPILRESSEDYRALYDKIIRPHSYEDKLKMMMVPIDYPVTRAMTKDQKRQYLNAIYAHFTGLGFKLTEPDDDFFNCKVAQEG